MDEKEKKVLVRLQNLCVRRECCESDIYSKALKAMEGDSDAADRILKSLVEDKFISNLRYASAYAREKASISGWGSVKIRYMLAAKGVDSDTISEALEEIDETSANEILEKILAAKYRMVAEDKDCKLKLLRYALGRGYNYEEVKSVVDDIIKSGGKNSL